MNKVLALATGLVLILSCITPALAEEVDSARRLVTPTPVPSGSLLIAATIMDREPMAGVDVMVTAARFQNRARTDAQGNATLRVPKGMMLSITILAQKLQPLKFEKAIPQDQEWGRATVSLYPTGHGQSVLKNWQVGHGDPGHANQVTNYYFKVSYYRTGPNAPGVSGAIISLRQRDGKVFRTLTTDSKGIAKTSLPQGQGYQVQVTARGYHPYNTMLLVKESHNEVITVNILLRRSGGILHGILH